MFSTSDEMQPYHAKGRNSAWAKSSCRALSLLLMLFSYPAAAGVGATVKPSVPLPKIHYASSPYHTLTTQCPYPGTSNVTLIMASTTGSLGHTTVNNLKNCLEPQILHWTAEI